MKYFRKRTTIIFYATMILILCVFSCSTFAAEIADDKILPTVSGYGEELSNTGFETRKTLSSAQTASSWIQFTGASRTTAVKRSGSYGMCLDTTNSDTNRTYACQGGFSGLVTGGTYQFSAWVYRVDEGGSFCFGVEYYNSKDPVSTWRGSEQWGTETTVGCWTQVSTTFVMPADVTTVTAYCWLYGADCVAYVDDVSLRLVKEPIKATFTTDQIYYYTNEDVTTGTARITANSSVFSDYNTWTAGIKISDGESQIFAENNIAFSSDILDIDYPLNLFSDKEKGYKIMVEVKNSGGTVIFTGEETVYRKFARPSMMDKEGRFFINSEEFMPIFGYHVYDARDYYEQAKSLGINVIEAAYGQMNNPDAVISELDSAYANGFKAILSLYYQSSTGWDDEYRNGTKALVPLVKDHPALFGYCIMDEPVSKKIDNKLLAEAYEYIRSVDTVHPVYACDQQDKHADTLSKYNDIVCFDNYPGTAVSASTCISEVLSSADFYVKNQKKPTMTILKFYQDSQQFPYFPSASDMRSMIYQNFLAGGSGFGLYAIGYTDVTDYSTGTTIRNLDTPAADAIRSWNENEKKIVSDYFAYDKGDFIDEYETDDALWHLWTDGEKLYLVALNRSSSNAINLVVNNAALTTDSQISIVGGGEASSVTKIEKGSLSLQLPTASAILYCINNSDVVLASEETTSYSWKLYKKAGELYIDATNNISYTSKTITINHSSIKEGMSFINIDGTNSGEIVSIADGTITIKIKKSSSVKYTTDAFLEVDGEVIDEYYGDDFSWSLRENGETYHLIVKNISTENHEITVEHSLFDENTIVNAEKGGDSTTIVNVQEGKLNLSLESGASVLYVIESDYQFEISTESASSYNWRIYKKSGSIYIEANNLVSYTSKIITIQDENILNSMVFLATENSDAGQITSLTDGEIAIKVPKSGKVIYKAYDKTARIPVIYEGYLVPNAVNAGQTVTCSGYENAITYIALYDGQKLIQVKKSDLGESVDMTLNDVVETCNLKAFRWTSNLIPVSKTFEIR